MYVAQFIITPKATSKEAADEVYDSLIGYCGTLQNHGQVYGDEIIAWVGKWIQVTLKLAGPDAHVLKNHSKYGRIELRKLCRLCKVPPKWTMISDAAKGGQRAPDWRKESVLYLFTHFLDETSPVRCGSAGQRIPAYSLPIDDRQIEGMAGSRTGKLARARHRV